MTESAEVVVVGGGQAGLAASYYLSRADLPHLVLDASECVGDAWRRRWDSLELFSAAGFSELPGLAFPGDREHFPGKDEVADYLADYARAFRVPIRLGTEVSRLRRSESAYQLETGSGAVAGNRIIVATGAYQRPFVPAIAKNLSDEVIQRHSSEYRSSAQVAGDDVLVVGSGNSGAQIAGDLLQGHHVHLSRGSPVPYLPRRLLGKSLHWWGDKLGLIAAPLDSWRGRTQRGDLLIGTSLRQLVQRGVRLVGRTVRADGRVVEFDDGNQLQPDAVVWATGFSSDYTWIDLPVFDEGGLPVHRRGVTQLPGLYFLGMHNQYSRGSSLIGFVRHDAAYIVDHIRSSR